MSDRDDEERALWTRYAARRPAPEDPGCPGEVALAAFLEGHGDAAERARIEAHLAACPRCFAALGEAIRIQQEPPALVSQALLQRLRSAVAAEVAGPRRRVFRDLPAWLALAAALVFVCWTGFALGARTVSDRASLAERALGETSFGLGEALAFEGQPEPLPGVESR